MAQNGGVCDSKIEPNPGKLALLIGINHYLYSEPPDFPNLKGCLHDVDDMYELLTRSFGFEPEDILALRDQEATREGILRAIRSFAARIKKDDLAVFFYSGHGAFVDCDDRVNGRDQSIIPHDGNDPDAAILDITGAELNTELSKIATRNAVLIFDCCFSGSMLFRSAGRVRTIHRTRRPKSDSVMPAARGISFRPPDGPYVLLSACDQHELSDEREIDGIDRGLLTYSLTSVLRKSKALTYRDLMDQLQASLTALGASQHPQLEGANSDFVVFGDAQATPVQSYLLASPIGNGLVRLEGGLESGITNGSKYRIFAPSEKAFSEDRALATARITAVRDFSSDAEIVSGEQPPGASRAVEIDHVYENFKVPVFCDVPDSSVVAQLRIKASAFSHLTFVHNSAVWDLHIEFNAQQWKISRFGQENPIAVISDGPGAPDRMLEQLVHWAKWLNLLRLRNPSPQLKVGFSLRPLDSHEAPADRYYDDGRVECTVTNNSGMPLYLGILDFADTGSVTLIYPVSSPPMLLENQTLRKSFAIENLPEGRDTASDTLKLIATTTQRDLQVLELEAPGTGSRGFDDALGRLLVGSAFGRAADLDPVPLSGWTTVESEFAQERRR